MRELSFREGKRIAQDTQPKSKCSVLDSQARAPTRQNIKEGQTVLKSNSSPWELPRVPVPRRRRGVSWSNLAHWLINPTGAHSRKGKVKEKGKEARSFSEEKKAGPLLPPARRCGTEEERVFGCLAAGRCSLV